MKVKLARFITIWCAPSSVTIQPTIIMATVNAFA